MPRTSSRNRPFLSFLSEQDQQRIYEAALEILDSIGMQIFHHETLSVLKDAGCRVEENGIVKIAATLVEKAIETAPSNIRIYNREGKHVMDLGGDRSYFGTGSDLMYSLEPERFERHRCSLEDVKRAARVCDALPNIDFIMSFAHPEEIKASRSYLHSFAAMAESSVKPIVCTAAGRDDLSEMWEVARILRGSTEALDEQPYFIYYGEPISPLKFPVESLEKLQLCAEKRIPCIYSPAPLSGSNAPITIAGHVAQGLAECFCGLVIHQLYNEGAPFLMGMGAAVLDMASSQSSYNAPEYYMAYAAMVEMSHYFDLPCWGYAGTSDSQIPDEQATLESAMLTFQSTMTGANLNHDVGYLNFGLTGSLEMIVIGDEIIDMARRMKRGIEVNDETLALDAIREVGHDGHHLIHPHTLKHLRDVQWRPTLISRKSYEQWEKGGSLTLMQRARQKLRKILGTHQAEVIPAEKLEAIQKQVNQFKG